MKLPATAARSGYVPGFFFNEMYEANGTCRPHYQEFARWLANTPLELLEQRRREADLLFHRAGITFTLYGDKQDTER